MTRQLNEINHKLAVLTGMIVETKPAPAGFDYKSAVFSIFEANKTTDFSIDDVANKVSAANKFNADRQMVANRMNYLTDREGVLERVEGRRGIYRMKPKAE